MFEWKLPELVNGMTGATLECAYVREGEAVAAGTKVFDISVDLSSAFAQECPPISYFRVIVREAVAIRRLMFAPGQNIGVGDLVALFSSTLDQDLTAPVERQVRIATAGIMHHDAMWSGSDL
jgi:hypothetical protein